jgi:hypothetical protein
MIKSKTHKPNWIIALGIPILIFAVGYFITLTSKFKAHDDLLSKAILFDFLLFAPFVYFLAIRKSNVSKLTILRIFVLGLFVAGLILNVHQNLYLNFIKTWIGPLIEICVIFFVVKKFYIANKIAKQNNNDVDFLSHCRNIMFQVIGNQNIANVVSSEIAVIYYCFFKWRNKSVDNQTKFTSYKANGIMAVLWVFLFILMIDTAVVHLVLNLWSNTIAWILTALSVYTCLQLFAHIKAIKARPIIINSNSLEIHNGLAGDALIDFGNIEKFELSEKMPLNCNPIKISLLKGIEDHNIIMYLKAPIEVNKVFGIKKVTDTVLFYIDKPQEFSDSLISKLKPQ